MTDPRQAAIEAALAEWHVALKGEAPVKTYLQVMQAAIAAYERALSDAGVVRVRDVGVAKGDPIGAAGRHFVLGWDTCRAAMLAGRDWEGGVMGDTVTVPRKLLTEAHACMRETGWHLAAAGDVQGDGVLQAAVADVEERFAAMLARPVGVVPAK